MRIYFLKKYIPTFYFSVSTIFFPCVHNFVAVPLKKMLKTRGERMRCTYITTSLPHSTPYKILLSFFSFKTLPYHVSIKYIPTYHFLLVSEATWTRVNQVFKKKIFLFFFSLELTSTHGGISNSRKKTCSSTTAPLSALHNHIVKFCWCSQAFFFDKPFQSLLFDHSRKNFSSSEALSSQKYLRWMVHCLKEEEEEKIFIKKKVDTLW